MRSYIIILTLLLGAFPTLSQTRITGRVLDKAGSPSEGFVTLSLPGESTILYYADIDTKGIYTLTCENAKLAQLISDSDRELVSLIADADDLKFYLRGLFLACGRTTDPHAEAHLEFSLSSADAADRLSVLMQESGLDKPGRSKRRDKHSVYYKSRDRISDMLTAMDAGALVFDYLNSAIYKSLEWNERRAINMISGNINRSVIAAERQAAACRYLIENKRGALLTPELYETAILRVNNVNLSLSELAAAHNPVLTKSGLNNRLKRIIDIAEKNGYTN